MKYLDSTNLSDINIEKIRDKLNSIKYLWSYEYLKFKTNIQYWDFLLENDYAASPIIVKKYFTNHKYKHNLWFYYQNTIYNSEKREMSSNFTTQYNVTIFEIKDSKKLPKFEIDEYSYITEINEDEFNRILNHNWKDVYKKYDINIYPYVKYCLKKVIV